MKTSVQSAFINCVAVIALTGCGPPALYPGQKLVQNDALPASTYRVLYHFQGGRNGATPVASLLSVKGTLYGTTLNGGISSFGTVYSVDKSGLEKVLYSFNGRDGYSPDGGLIELSGTLYGTTFSGGKRCPKRGCGGTVYSVSTSGVAKVIYTFKGGSDGFGPEDGLLNVRGTLYGTTVVGGDVSRCIPSGCGTIFSVTPSGVEKVVYRFGGRSDGAGPEAKLINLKGTLYGTTVGGGAIAQGKGCQAYGCGTIFSVTTTGREKVLHRFKGGSDGQAPKSGLAAVNGMLYGTTPSGGSNIYGTAYRISTNGEKEVIFRFDRRSKGENPLAGLVDVNGTLYGTTGYGGSSCGCGTVFSLTTTGTEHVLHDFAGGPDGANPWAALISVKGTLYGTTSGGLGSCGGTNGCGTVYALTPQS